jgi:hypothetical protein
MYRRDLDYRAARRNKPVKPLPDRQSGYGTRVRFACTYLRKSFEMLSHYFNVEFRPKRVESSSIDMDPCLQKLSPEAEDNYTSVYKFLALHTRDHSDRGELKGV